MHLHASALDAVVFAAYLLIIMAALRTLAAKIPDSAFGQGLAYILG